MDQQSDSTWSEGVETPREDAEGVKRPVQYCRLEESVDTEAEVRRGFLLQQHDDWFKGGAITIGDLESHWERDEIYDQLMRDRVQVFTDIEMGVQQAPGQGIFSIEHVALGGQPSELSNADVVVFLATSVGTMESEREVFWTEIIPALQYKYNSLGISLMLIDLQKGCSDDMCNSAGFINYFLDELSRAQILVAFVGESYGEPVELPQDRGAGKAKARSLMDHLATNLNTRNPTIKALWYIRNSGDDGAAVRSSPEEQERQRDLRARIMVSGQPVMENYPEVYDIRDQVKLDVTQLIDSWSPHQFKSEAEQAAEHTNVRVGVMLDDQWHEHLLQE